MAWKAEGEGERLEPGIKLMFPFSILDPPFSGKTGIPSVA